MAGQVYALRHQPLKTIYLLYEVGTTLLVRLPYWMVKHVFRANRPRPSWSYKQSMIMEFVRRFVFFGPVCARVGPLTPEPDYMAIVESPGSKGVWLEPTPDLILGDVKAWAEAGNVQPARIPGYWYDKKGHDTSIGAAPEKGEKVLYMLHGGAFIGLSAHVKGTYANAFRKFVNTHPTARRALAVEYRLTTGPPLEETHPFPAALLDAIAGYAYLTDVVGFAPEDIIVEGDSAGGNLAVALVRYLIENRNEKNNLPASPGALLLVSPWVDLGSSHDTPGSSQQTSAATDFVPPYQEPLMFWARKHYSSILGFPAAANTSRYISPASVDPEMEPVSFKGFPKTFVLFGDAECLYDQDVTLVGKMVADLGEEVVQHHVVKDAVHDIMLAPFFEALNVDAFQAIGQWFETL